MLGMFSISDAKAAHVVVFAFDTLECDARNAAIALSTNDNRSSKSVGNRWFLATSSLFNFE